MRAFERILIHAKRAEMKTGTLPGNRDAKTIDVSRGGDFEAELLDGNGLNNGDSLLICYDFATGVEIRIKGPWGTDARGGLNELGRIQEALKKTLYGIEDGENRLAGMVHDNLLGRDDEIH